MEIAVAVHALSRPRGLEYRHELRRLDRPEPVEVAVELLEGVRLAGIAHERAERRGVGCLHHRMPFVVLAVLDEEVD